MYIGINRCVLCRRCAALLPAWIGASVGGCRDESGLQLRRNAAAARVALLTSVVMSFLELERTPRSFDFYSLRTCKRLHLDAVLQPISIGVWKGVAGTEIESSPIF